jgi:hypothetical protein
MKTLILLLALLTTNQMVYSKIKGNIFNPSSINFQKSTEDKIEDIQNLHRNIYNLPFDRDYIIGTIMVEVQHKRSEVAPHFPSREQTGTDETLVNSAFKNWIENYPAEYTNYIQETQLIIRKYSLNKK